MFTDPSYWLPIGIAHVLFTKYECEKTLLNQSKRLIGYKTFSNSSKRAVAFVIYNVIPISAVLINNCAST